MGSRTSEDGRAGSRLPITSSLDPVNDFWRSAYAFRAAAPPIVFWRVFIFGAYAFLVCGNDWVGHHHALLEVGLAPYEVAGAALGLLLVLRTNAGYDRWWEGRKLWGGIVNQCRHLGVVAIAYGPNDLAWRERAVRLIAAFAHATRSSLRDERALPEIEALLGPVEVAQIAAARHMPGYVALLIADHLRSACDQSGMDRFAFLEADRDLTSLLDHVGGCERIRKTPLPRAYAIQIRQFLILFLATLPFALLKKVEWLTPLVTVLVAYPLLSLDEIGNCLQAPFSTRTLNHLPLDDICRTIEEDLLAMLSARSAALA
ncbi:MAG: bestrophin family ion channel [Isosphaeraceae bacterium]|nr:bestrophin family ion channel [Isosphaeraceae bacterium]